MMDGEALVSFRSSLTRMIRSCAVMNGACHKEIFRTDAIRWEEHEMIARVTQKVTLMRVHMHM